MAQSVIHGTVSKHCRVCLTVDSVLRIELITTFAVLVGNIALIELGAFSENKIVLNDQILDLRTVNLFEAPSTQFCGNPSNSHCISYSIDCSRI